jgi:hypothetical protein
MIEHQEAEPAGEATDQARWLVAAQPHGFGATEAGS